MPCSLVPQDVSAASFGCRESQSYVVGHPVSIGIAKLGFQDRPNLLQIVAASFVGEALKKIESKSFQVTNDVARQGSWTRDQRNAIDAKPCAFQPGGVVAGRGEIPRNASLAIKPTAVQCLNQSSPDLVNATVASEFSNKSAAWFQRTIHSSKHHICTPDPVQHGITKHGIEFLLVRQVFAADRGCVLDEPPR